MTETMNFGSCFSTPIHESRYAAELSVTLESKPIEWLIIAAVSSATSSSFAYFGSPNLPPMSRLSRSAVMVECVISCSMVE